MLRYLHAYAELSCKRRLSLDCQRKGSLGLILNTLSKVGGFSIMHSAPTRPLQNIGNSGGLAVGNLFAAG